MTGGTGGALPISGSLIYESYDAAAVSVASPGALGGAQLRVNLALGTVWEQAGVDVSTRGRRPPATFDLSDGLGESGSATDNVAAGSEVGVDVWGGRWRWEGLGGCGKLQTMQMQTHREAPGRMDKGFGMRDDVR